MASTATGSSGRPVSNENHTSSTLASASKEVHEAIELDKAGKYVEAKAKYTTALCGFLVVLRAETDPARKRALAAKMESYMARAEEIAQFVEGSDDAEGDDGDGDDDDDDDNALDEKAQALIDGLRSSLHNLQREQEKLLKRLNDFEAAPTSVGERTSSKSSNESSNDVASARPAADRSHGSEQPAVHNFYAVSVTTVLLAFSVQCTIAFALLMQMQVAFPGVDARLVFAASMFASLLAICGASALACCCGGGHGSHTVYFGFPFNRQVRASTLGIAKLVSLVLQDESIQSNQERPQAPTAHNDNNGASDDPQETVEEEAPETATTAQPAEADETASNVDHSSTSASTGATAPSTTDEARVTTGPATADTSVEETTAPEADTPPSVQTVDDRLRRFDKTLMLASIAAAADPDATNNPLMLEAASILDGFSDAEEATLQQEEKIALLWRRARCLVKQARSFSKAERVPILSKAHATAQQAYNLAVGARGGVCSDPQVLLWYGISIVEYRLPAADGNNEKIQATKDFVDMVTSAYEHSKALPSTDPRRHELLGTCCFVLGCFHIESTKTIMKLGWMLRKIVARFLPPTSFAEAVEFLEKALDVNYYDTRAAAAWLAVAQQLNGDTDKAKATCAKHELDQAYFKADEGLRKNLKRMNGVF